MKELLLPAKVWLDVVYDREWKCYDWTVFVSGVNLYGTGWDNEMKVSTYSKAAGDCKTRKEAEEAGNVAMDGVIAKLEALGALEWK